MSIEPAALDAFSALAVGIAFAGLLASAFELFTARRASFQLLQSGDLRAVAAVPVVVFSAPFIILRNTLLGRQIEGRPLVFVFLATIIACFWGLMCGRIVLDALLGMF